MKRAAAHAFTVGRVPFSTARTKSSTRSWWLPSWPLWAPWKAAGSRATSCTGAWPEMNAGRSSGATWASDGSSTDRAAVVSSSAETSVTAALSCHTLTVASCSKLPSVPKKRNRDSRMCDG